MSADSEFWSDESGEELEKQFKAQYRDMQKSELGLNYGGTQSQLATKIVLRSDAGNSQSAPQPDPRVLLGTAPETPAPSQLKPNLDFDKKKEVIPEKPPVISHDDILNAI